jgi:hypothetical protein
MDAAAEPQSARAAGITGSAEGRMTGTDHISKIYII